MFLVIFEHPPPSEVQSGRAIFESLGVVLLRRLNDHTFLGRRMPGMFTSKIRKYALVYIKCHSLPMADTHLTLIKMWISFSPVWMKTCEISANGWSLTNSRLLIGSRQKLNTLTASPVLSVNGTPINQVSTSKSQGVFTDANLTWGSHIEKLAKKIASGIAAIKRVMKFAPPVAWD